MAVPTRITDLSATASSNSPAGTDTIGTSIDDYLRAAYQIIRGDLATKGADIASAATTDLGAVQGLSHDITGTTTITSFGTVAAGVWKIVKFEGALTLTHNATSLILPGAANITTADGDIGLFASEGSGNWRCVTYFKAASIYATLAGTETLSGKTVTNPANTDQTLTDAASIDWNMNSGGIASVTLGGNRTMNAPTNLKKGCYILHVIQDGTGSRTITWNAVFKWAAGTAPTLTTGVSKRDILSFVCDGTSLYGSIMLDVR